MRGTFRHGDPDPLTNARERLLGGATSLPWPYGDPPRIAPDDVDAVHTAVRQQLRDQGVALVDLGVPLSTEAFLELGRRLGDPQPERAPDVRDRVEEDVILDLVTTHPATDEPSLQPFASGWVSLHTESSGAPLPGQPRYVVLMCHDPGDTTAAQTLVVPMQSVAAALTAAELELLGTTSYADRPGAPPIVRREQDRWVFSVRDFQAEPLAWQSSARADPGTVRAALARLFGAMYERECYGVVWRRGYLLVVDNQRHFHGRAAARVWDPRRKRHLRRLRIAEVHR